MKAFKLEAADAEHIVDAVNQVSNNTAVSSADLATNIGKASAAMAQGNNTYEQALAMMTGITEITRNGAKSARGLISIQSRLNQITDEGSSTGKKLTAWYKEHNIAIYDQEGQLKNLYEIAGEVAKIWDSLSKNEQMYYLNTQAGANQTQNLSALISNYDQVLYAHEQAINSVNSAQNENNRFMESAEAKIQNFKAAFQELALNLINSDLVKNIIDLGTALLKFANTDLGQATIKIAAFSGTLKALGLVVGKLGLVESFTKLGKAIKSAFTFTETVKVLTNMQGASLRAGAGLKAYTKEVTKTTTGLGALAKNAKIAIGAMSGFSKVALALGAMYGIFQLFMYIAEKPARDLEKAKNQLAETKNELSDVVSEADTLEEKQEKLAKSGKELADSEKERLKYLKDQTEELEAQSLTQAKQMVKAAYKGLGTVKDPFATGTVQYKTEEDAAQALINKYIELQRQYHNNQISQAEFVNSADQVISRLAPLYEGLQEVIDNGGELTGVDKALYESIYEVAGAFVNAGGQCSFYNSALSTVSSNTSVAKLIVDKFNSTLVEEGGTYKFVSAAARAEAQDVLNLEAEKTRATLAEVNTRIAARLAEYSTYAGLVSSESGLRGRRGKDGSLQYATTAEKEAAEKAQLYYKYKQAAADVGKMGVSSGSLKTPSSSTPSGSSGSSGSSSKKTQDESEKIKKILDSLDDKYLESYQRREIIASKYYNKIQKKAWSYYKKGKIDHDEYNEYVQQAAKNIFEEIDYRYENGIYDADTYYKKVTYFANKFYKKTGTNNKITYEEYRDYIKKATEATIDAVEEQYDKGLISGQDYFNKVKKLAEDAKKKKILSTKEYKEYMEKAYEKLFDSIADQYERGKISAEDYYKTIKIKGKQAVKEGTMNVNDLADALKEAAEAMKDMAQTKLDAFEFFAEDKKTALDERIEKEQLRIDALNEQLEAMRKQNDELDKQAERMELVNALAAAKKNKIRIFDERLGWVRNCPFMW